MVTGLQIPYLMFGSYTPMVGRARGAMVSNDYSPRVVSMFTLCSSDSPAPILNHLLYA